MTNNELNPKVLGQLLLMQSIVINLPDNKSIFSFISKGLKDIPGIKDVRHNKNVTKSKDRYANTLYFPITTNNNFYGELEIFLNNIELFSPYNEYIENFVFMIGVILQEKYQRQINENYQLELEENIKIRTSELQIEKENLIESQRRFNDLMSNVRLLSVMLDIDGNIIFCNNFLLEVTGYEYDDIINKNWFDIFLPPDNIKQVKKVFKDAIDGSQFITNYENNILTKTREKLYISWNNTVLFDVNKKIIGTASIGEDITQRKKNEQLLIEKSEKINAQNEEYIQINEELFRAKEKAEESDRLKTAFLQNVSHEIRTPLNAIMGFSDLLVNTFNDKDKLKKFTDIIRLRSNDLLHIINDILDISKIESGALYVAKDNFTTNNLFKELELTVNSLKKRINKDHIELFFKIDESINTITADKGKLNQIFINLISNALKFTEKGMITCGNKIENNELLFFVKDTGIGIPPDKFESIFERFTQLNPVSHQNIEGTGLGLSIVKALVKLLGGKIWLESTVGIGTTFYFTIEYQVSTGILDKKKSENPRIKTLNNNKTILIVEDDFYNSEFLKEIFTRYRFKTISTMFGNEAIEIATNQSVDIVLMDISLPDINGYEATHKILESKPDLKIIAQTAYATMDERRKALKMGCIDYISKPIKANSIIHLVDKYLTI